jgi:hypothetical protein
MTFKDQYIQYLTDAKIPFETKNGGVHLIVEGPHGYIDVWPTTGKWSPRPSEGNPCVENHFGYQNLITYLVSGALNAASL